jgi:lycopene beta-cyclase
MTYLGFHLVFIVPPLLVLLYMARRAPARLGSRAWWTLPVVAAIALIYTTPWDNYLVYRGIWWYGADRVIGTIGYVPVEEYLFFILQPLLTGAWTYFLLLRTDAIESGLASRSWRQTGATTAATAHLALPGSPRAVGVALYLLLTAAGGLALTYTAGLYLGLILVWVGPVLAAQWFFVAETAAARARTFTLAVAVPTLYLWVADRIAIGAGIWSISPDYTTGVHLAGLPIEEAIFFLATNLLVVQGVLLFLQPALATTPPPRSMAGVA